MADSYLINFQREGTLADIDKVVDKNSKYTSRRHFIEIAVEKLLAEEKTASKPRK